MCVCALPWRPDASRRASFLFFAALCVRVCVCVAMATGRVQTCLRFLCCPVCVCVAMATGRVQTCLLLVLCCRVCVCVDFQGYSFDSEAYWAIRIFSFLFFLHFLSDPRLSLGRESNVWKQQQQQKKPASHRFITQPVLPPFPSTFIPLSLSLFLFVYWSIRLVCASIMRDLNSVKNDFGFHGDQ